MILYHGSNMVFRTPLLMKCSPHKDFGQGFYVTIMPEQARLWADRMARQRRTKGVLSVYTLDMKALREKYSYLFFPKYDSDWLNFIANSRTGKKPWAGYDCIEGGIANDRVIDMVEAYIAHTVTAEFALSELSKHQPNHQICILNQQALNECLHFKKSIVC